MSESDRLASQRNDEMSDALQERDEKIVKLKQELESAIANWQYDRQAVKREAHNAAVEECAKWLDAKAQEFNRQRDPGMANQARSYATSLRALARQVPAMRTLTKEPTNGN